MIKPLINIYSIHTSNDSESEKHSYSVLYQFVIIIELCNNCQNL